MTTEADLAIVGAGPAGAAAACHFARAGFRVVLMDQYHFPRDKVCGDFVGPWALEELERLGLCSLAPFCNANRIRRAALHLNGTEIVSASVPQLPALRDYGLCIPRVLMDEAIVNAAVASGARVLQEAHVTSYEADTSGVSVYYQNGSKVERIRARLLLGADGSTSRIALILRGARAPRRDRIIAVRAYFEGVHGAEDQAALYADAAVFPGYYWLFPSGDGFANVGIGMLLETMPANDEQLRSRLSDLIHTDAAMHQRLAESKIRGKIVGWPLATFNPRLQIVGDRVALIGDAAGLINPLNGEGIHYALQSARWCVETLSNALLRDELSRAHLAPYAARVHAEMRFDMAVSRLLVDLTRNRTLNHVWLSVLRIIGTRATIDAEYADIFGGVLAGIARARQLLTVPFFWRTVKQATAMARRTTAEEASRAFASMAAYSARHPAATFNWSMQCMATVLELATQARLVDR